MRIALALFADYAMAHQDGKLYVMGGGLHTLRFPAFPANQPRLALAVGLELLASEYGTPHTMTIEATGPTQQSVVKVPPITFTVAPDGRDDAQPHYLHVVSNMENVAFASEGIYSFTIIIDSKPLHAVELAVTRSEGELSVAMQSAARLAEGYTAFADGELALAEDIFRDVVVRFPSEANGPNNLGFILLSRGKAQEALELFNKARELGFTQREIHDANVGCALYLIGDYAGALRAFQQCLRANLFSGPATLFGIEDKTLFSVGLGSAGEYVSLVTLNAAWSATASADALAVHYLDAARASELTLRGEPESNQFLRSVRALSSRLGS